MDTNKKKLNEGLNEEILFKLAEEIRIYASGNDINETIARQQEENRQFLDKADNKRLDKKQAKELTYHLLTQQDASIKLTGFEDDPDLINFQQEIDSWLNSDIKNKLLISEINYDSNEVLILFNNFPYKIPNQVFLELRMKYPDYDWLKAKRRAFSEVSFVTDKSAFTYYKTPIKIFSFAGEKIDDIYVAKNLPYLQSIALNKRLENFKKGTIWHEIGHHIYSYIVEKSEKNNHDWQELVENFGGGITPYSKIQKELIHETDFAEDFAEAIRLYMKNKEYLQKKYPDAFEYLKDFFNSID